MTLVVGAFTIGFILVMGAFIGRYALQHMKEDERGGGQKISGAH